MQALFTDHKIVLHLPGTPGHLPRRPSVSNKLRPTLHMGGVRRNKQESLSSAHGATRISLGRWSDEVNEKIWGRLQASSSPQARTTKYCINTPVCSPQSNDMTES